MIQVQCPGCGQKLKAKEELAGRRLKCPGCGDPVLVPAGRPSAPPGPRGHVPAAVVIPSPAPVAGRPANPFGFVDQPAAVGSPTVMLDMAAGSSPYPRRPRRSPVRSWTVHGAILGTLIGALIIALVRPSDLKLVEWIGKAFPNANPMELSATIRGAIQGAIVGLAVAGLMVILIGRSLESLLGAFLVWVGGGVYGAFRKAPIELGEVEPVWMMMTLGAIAGTLGGMLLGLLIGAIIAAARGPAPRSP
jgi:hypothetical protein